MEALLLRMKCRAGCEGLLPCCLVACSGDRSPLTANPKNALIWKETVKHCVSCLMVLVMLAL